MVRFIRNNDGISELTGRSGTFHSKSNTYIFVVAISLGNNKSQLVTKKLHTGNKLEYH